MNAVISKHNSEIAVNLQVFDDLNLRTLLDSVSKVQNSYDDAVQRKLAVVSKMEQELAIKSLDNAKSKGLVHRNKVDREKSRLTLKVNKMESK